MVPAGKLYAVEKLVNQGNRAGICDQESQLPVDTRASPDSCWAARRADVASRVGPPGNRDALSRLLVESRRSMATPSCLRRTECEAGPAVARGSTGPLEGFGVVALVFRRPWASPVHLRSSLVASRGHRHLARMPTGSYTTPCVDWQSLWLWQVGGCVTPPLRWRWKCGRVALGAALWTLGTPVRVCSESGRKEG